MDMKFFFVIVLTMAGVMAGGCSRQQEQTAPAEGAASAQAKAAEPMVHLVQQDIRVIAPAQAAEGSMSLFHKLGEDAVEAVMPLAGEESFAALIGTGDHDVLLTQDSCGFGVEVEVRNEKDEAVLTTLKLSQSGERGAILPGGDQETRRVTAHMAAGAENNFGCNLMLRKKL